DRLPARPASGAVDDSDSAEFSSQRGEARPGRASRRSGRDLLESAPSTFAEDRPMKLKDFLKRLPEPFAVEILEALPAPDRRELLRHHGAKVAMGAGSLKRADRIHKEVRLLLAALATSDDVDTKRTYLQGWLARR